tara:strand:+ start:284 stop:601 length:318 start_codon:yes stop_codon:yes gene_type:complete
VVVEQLLQEQTLHHLPLALKVLMVAQEQQLQLMELQQLSLVVVEVDQVVVCLIQHRLEQVEQVVVEQDQVITKEIILQEQLTLAAAVEAVVDKTLDLLVKMVVQE